MNTPPQVPQKLRRWLIIVALLMAALLVPLCIIAVLVLSPGDSGKVQARIDALKKAGYPVSAEGLAKLYPPLPDDQNSVVIYRKAFVQYVPLPDDTTNWPIVGDSKFAFRSSPLPPEVKQGIAAFVNQNQATLELLHQAAGIEKGYYDEGIGAGMPFTGHPPTLEISDCARLLALAAVLEAENHQQELAANAILDELALARSLEHDPTLSGMAVRNHLLSLAGAAYELSLNRSQFSEDRLFAFSEKIRKADAYDGLKELLAAERCDGIWLNDLLTSNPFKRPNEPLRGKIEDLIYSAVHYRKSEFIYYLDSMEQSIAAAGDPYPKRLELAKQIDAKNRAHLVEDTNNAFGLNTNWESFCQFMGKAHAQLLLAETAIAIERFRLANADNLPQTLAELTPAFLPSVPMDPFDGKPLRYRLLPKGYEIYSVGPDQKDDGGREWDNEKQSGDITFTVER